MAFFVTSENVGKTRIGITIAIPKKRAMARCPIASTSYLRPPRVIPITLPSRFDERWATDLK